MFWDKSIKIHKKLKLDFRIVLKSQNEEITILFKSTLSKGQAKIIHVKDDSSCKGANTIYFKYIFRKKLIYWEKF